MAAAAEVTIVGIELTLVTVLQLGITLAFVLFVSISYSNQEGQHEHQSDTDTLFLIATTDYGEAEGEEPRPSREVLKELTGATDAQLADHSTTIHYFGESFDKFVAAGSLPTLDEYTGSNARESLTALVTAPVLGLIVFGVYLMEARSYRLYRIVATTMRMNVFSKGLLMGTGSAIYLAAAIQLATSTGSELLRFAAIVIAIVAAASVLVCLGALVYLLAAQAAWKRYWWYAVSEVMAAAWASHRQGAFNQAALLRQEVKNEPDVPLPGVMKLVVTIYSGLSAVLIVLSDRSDIL